MDIVVKLSRRQQGFESPWGRQLNQQVKLIHPAQRQRVSRLSLESRIISGVCLGNKMSQ
jgi:hypothetical protein